jgi:hypothetical protein
MPRQAYILILFNFWVNMSLMRLIFLIFTLIFSVGVLADCCNFEIESSIEKCSSIDLDHCRDSSEQTSEPDHCHSCPMNQPRILSSEEFVITLPANSFTAALIPAPDSLFNSDYESSIFHPPIA